MSDQFVAEIRMFGFNFPPTGWAFCNGQLMPISQNTALFSLLGTTYGGDGKSTFALPDLQGNVPVSFGQSTTGTLWDLGEITGEETVTLLSTEIPFHTHTLRAGTDPGEEVLPSPTTSITRAQGGGIYQPTTGSGLANMATQALAPAGTGLPHNNMQPYLTLNFCIALQGIFPPRS